MIESEVSPARLRYELPKLGIAGSNPALRTFLAHLFRFCKQICFQDRKPQSKLWKQD